MITKNSVSPLDVKLGEHEVIMDTQNPHYILLDNAQALDLDNHTMLDFLDYWSSKTPNTVFMRERTADGWSEISFKEFKLRTNTIATHLGSLPISADKPLMIISPNSINHAITAFSAMSLGVPICPISISYAIYEEALDKLLQIINSVQPGAILFSNTNMFKSSIQTLLDSSDIPCIAFHSDLETVKEVKQLDTISQEEAKRKRDQITQDTICKIMMTSGSTGHPKGVINTHKMMYSNQLAVYKMWPFLKDMIPSQVSWLPWSHTFGGNVCVNIALFNGGTLTIDDGKPIPSQIGRTIENISLIEPNIHFDVPAGIESLLAVFEDNHRLAKQFYSSVKVVFVAAAALPEKTRNRFLQLGQELVGSSPRLLAGWGSTETSPFATCLNFETDCAVNIGVPIPGTTIKLSHIQDKWGLSVKGPNVTLGYWRNDKATAEAFDQEGYYNMGDAGRLVNPEDPSQGLIFEGRLSENFKLMSGTWVTVNEVRIAIITALKPLILDAVITGQNMSDLGVLLVPNLEYIAKKFNLSEEQMTVEHLQSMDMLVNELTALLNDYNEINFSNSKKVERFAFLPKPPSMQNNEITDKGYLNQQALLKNWSQLINAMHDVEAKAGIYFHHV